MKKTYAGLVILVLAYVSAPLGAALDQQTRDALNVSHILKTIARKTPTKDGKRRTATVSERELGAYIGWRLAREPENGIRDLTIDLLADNHVAGTIRFDAARLNLGRLLGDALDFDFKGIIHTRNRAARLELIALALNGFTVKPQVLDYVLESAARAQGAESAGLDDWYPLPDGVDDVIIVKDAAQLFY